MSLSRSGAAVAAWTRVVETVKDLPAPAATAPNERVLVAATEEIYQLDPMKKTWGCIGTLKKLDGKTPSEIAAHLDSTDNPHGTALQDAYASGPEIALDEKTGELSLSAAKGSKLHALLRLMQGEAAGVIRIGPDAGRSTGVIWINGSASGEKTVLRVVDDKDTTKLALDVEGNADLSTISLRKGVRGDLAVEGDVTAKILAAPAGSPLKLRGTGVEIGDGVCADKDGNLGVGTKAPKAKLDVEGDIRFTGQIDADLIPKGSEAHVGSGSRRWAAAFAELLDLKADVDRPFIKIQGSLEQESHYVAISSPEGDLFVLDAGGQLGLGAAPEHMLDVRGDGIAVGAPAKKARWQIVDQGAGDVVVGFNLDGADPETAAWSLVTGNAKRDYFEVARGGNSLLRVENGRTVVRGKLLATELMTTALSASAVVSPDGKTTLKLTSEGALHTATAHKLEGPVTLDPQGGLGLTILGSDGKPMLVVDSAGGIIAKRMTANDVSVSLVSIGQTQIADGHITTKRDLVLDPASGRIGLPGRMAIAGAELSIDVSHTDNEKLSLLGSKHGIDLDVSDDNLSINFTGKGGWLGHVRRVRMDSDEDRMIEATQERNDASKVYDGFLLDVADKASKVGSAYLRVRKNGQEMFAVDRDGVALGGAVEMGGLVYDKIEAEVALSTTGTKTVTSLVIPAGVVVQCVRAVVVEAIDGPAFWTGGDAVTKDRFISPQTSFGEGATATGLNQHGGQAAQDMDGPLVLWHDAPATKGKLKLTLYFFKPV